MKIVSQCRKALNNKMFPYVYLPAIVGIATSGLLFQQIYLLQQVWSCYWILTVSNWLLYILCFISFYQSIRINNKIPSAIPTPRQRSQLVNNHPIYIQKSECQKQNNRYKPPRTSHCHIDGCIARFVDFQPNQDHHCVYIDNCLGYSNLKAFLLFITYGGLFALQFLWTSIATYLFMIDKGSITYTEIVIVVWMILTVVSFALALAMLGLAVLTLAYLAKNITKIDVLKGTFKFKDSKRQAPNPYDLGIITNFTTVFHDLNGDVWSWWWPTKIIPLNDGIRFPMVPPVTTQDFKQLPANIQDKLGNSAEKEIALSMEELRKKQHDKYENVIFFFNGEQYRMQEEKKISFDPNPVMNQ